MIFIAKDGVEQLHLLSVPLWNGKQILYVYLLLLLFIKIALPSIWFIFHTTFFHHYKNLWIENNMFVPWCALFWYM